MVITVVAHIALHITRVYSVARKIPIRIDDLPQRTVRSNMDLDKYLRNAAFR